MDTQVDLHSDASLTRARFDLPERGGAVSALVSDKAGAAAPTLIFAHANGFNAQTYTQVFGPLADVYRIVLPDLRGHGHTDLPADPETLRNWHIYRDDLVALMDQVGTPPYVLAGHSFGGTSLFLASQMRADQVKHLVLADPVFMPRIAAWVMSWGRPSGLTLRLFPIAASAAKRRNVFPSVEAAVDSYVGRAVFKTWPEEMVRDYVHGGTGPRADGQVELLCEPAWEAATYLSHTHNIWRYIDRVRFPIQVFRAEKNSTFFPFMAKRLKLTTPQTHIETLAGTSHSLPMERPDIIQNFLRGLI